MGSCFKLIFQNKSIKYSTFWMSFRGTNCTKFAANSFTSRPVIWTNKSYLDTNARPVVDTTFGWGGGGGGGGGVAPPPHPNLLKI